MFVKDLRKEDRPLERLIEKGPEALSNAELLAIVLWKLKNCSVFEKASEILKKQNVKRLFECSVGELENLIGDKIKACQITSCFELARRALSYVEEKPLIESPEDVYKILGPEMQGLKQEVVRKNVAYTSSMKLVSFINSFNFLFLTNVIKFFIEIKIRTFSVPPLIEFLN